MSEENEVKTLDVTQDFKPSREDIIAVRQKGKRGKWATRACKIDELIASGKELLYRLKVVQTAA